MVSRAGLFDSCGQAICCHDSCRGQRDVTRVGCHRVACHLGDRQGPGGGWLGAGMGWGWYGGGGDWAMAVFLSDRPRKT